MNLNEIEKEAIAERGKFLKKPPMLDRLSTAELRDRLEALKAAIGILTDSTVREKLDAIISALPEEVVGVCAYCSRSLELKPEPPDSEDMEHRPKRNPEWFDSPWQKRRRRK